MKHTLRRMQNPHWWKALKMELPTWQDVVFVAAVIAVIVSWCYVAYAYRLAEVGRDADAQRVRVLDACNHDKGLGSYVEKNGERFEVVCTFYERRVRT